MFVQKVAATGADAVVSAFEPFVAAVVPAFARELCFAGSSDLRQKSEMVAGAFHGVDIFFGDCFFRSSSARLRSSDAKWPIILPFAVDSFFSRTWVRSSILRFLLIDFD